MRIQSNSVNNPVTTKQTGGAAQGDFSKHLSETTKATQGTQTTKRAELPADLAVGIRDLANEFKSGSLNEEQVSQRFVELVMKNRFGLDASRASIKPMHQAISEIVGDNPQMMATLSASLKRIA